MGDACDGCLLPASRRRIAMDFGIITAEAMIAANRERVSLPPPFPDAANRRRLLEPELVPCIASFSLDEVDSKCR